MTQRISFFGTVHRNITDAIFDGVFNVFHLTDFF
jgi:hypothetical protein